jgi:hypothetical protein
VTKKPTVTATPQHSSSAAVHSQTEHERSELLHTLQRRVLPLRLTRCASPECKTWVNYPFTFCARCEAKRRDAGTPA